MSTVHAAAVQVPLAAVHHIIPGAANRVYVPQSAWELSQ